MIPEADIEAMKARLAAAAPGPWWTTDKRTDDQCWVMGTDGDVVAFAEDWVLGFSCGDAERGYAEGNAALIAACPTDLAALLAEREELRGLLAEARSAMRRLTELSGCPAEVYSAEFGVVGFADAFEACGGAQQRAINAIDAALGTP